MASYYKRGNSYVIRVSCGYNAEGKHISVYDVETR